MGFDKWRDDCAESLYAEVKALHDNFVGNKANYYHNKPKKFLSHVSSILRKVTETEDIEVTMLKIENERLRRYCEQYEEQIGVGTNDVVQTIRKD